MSASIRRSVGGFVLAACLLTLAVCFPSTASPDLSKARPGAHNSAAAAKARAPIEFAKLPLAFDRNDGQADARVKFLSRGHGYTMFLTPTDATLVLMKRHPGSNFRPPIGGGAMPAGVANPAINIIPKGGFALPSGTAGGAIPAGGSSLLSSRAASRAPGASKRVEGSPRSDSSSVIATEASKSAATSATRTEPTVDAIPIRMRIAGANPRAHIEGIDKLAAKTNYFIGKDPKRWHRGVPNYAKVKYTGVYRGIDLVFYGNPSQFEYDFVVSPKTSPKNIRLVFEGAQNLTIDSHGDLVITAGGEKIELRKPVVYQDGTGGRHSVAGEFAMLDKSTVGFKVGDYDRTRALVIDPMLVWAKVIPGNFLDTPNKVAIDSNNNPYLAGLTCSSDYPATTVAGPHTGCDAFVAKLDANTAAVDYSSVFGGSAFNEAFGIAVDQTGAAYVAGNTSSNDFPGAAGELLGPSDAFVAKLNTDGSLAWSRLFGGSHSLVGGQFGAGWTHGQAVAIPQGCASNCDVYFAGQTTMADYPTVNAFQSAAPNAFNLMVTAVASDGSAFFYSTYFNGGIDPLGGGSTWANGIAVDGSGKIYVAGGVDLATAPVTAISPHFGGTVDALVAKFDPAQSGGASLLWARYLGGSGYDQAFQIALDPGCSSNCPSYIAGQTYSYDFPTTAGAYQRAFGGNSDAFLTKLDGSGATLLSTYVGNAWVDSANDISIDQSGNLYIVGTSEETYPSVNQIEGAQGPNGILLKSSDGGLSFAGTGFPSSDSAITTLATDPTNANIVYAGTIRSGLQKSTNAGGSFAAVSAAPSIARLVFDPNNPSVVYAAAGTGLLKSIDGGNTFNPTSITTSVPSVAVDPNNSSNVYAGTLVINGAPAAGQVYESTDAAATFALLPGLSVGAVGALAVDPNDEAVYAGTTSGLFRFKRGDLAATGNMTTSRAWSAAALLGNGKVLVTGGDLNNGSSPLSSAELFDPSSNIFTATGSMAMARASHTATTLADGRVLVAGGGCVDGTGATNRAELYDPVSGTFSATPNMPDGFCLHAAARLLDGRVLLDWSIADLYDPVSGTFTRTGSPVVTYPNGRLFPTATTLQDGRVLITGGWSFSTGAALSSAELYDPSTGTFSLTANNMAVPRAFHTASLLPSGKVLIAGGSATSNLGVSPPQSVSAELFDPSTDMFSPTGGMVLPRDLHQATPLADGSVLITGGFVAINNATTLGERYNPSTGKFSIAGFEPSVRLLSTSAPLTDGRALIAGGVNSPTVAISSAELFDPNSATFQRTNVPWSTVNALAVDSTTVPSTVYASVVQGVVSSNSGFGNVNFTDFVSGGGGDALALDASVTPAKLYAGDGNGEVLSSTDQGNTFTVENITGFNPGPVTSLAAPSSAPGTLYAAPFEEFDATVSQLSPDFSTLLFSSFLGGTYGDFGSGIAVSPSGNAYLVGGTASPDFPGAASQLEGRSNVFVAKLGNTGTGSSVSVEPCNNCLVTFPTVNSGGNTVASTSTVGPPLPTGYASTGSFTLISTTASVTATTANPIQVCFDYAGANVTNPANLSLLHFQDNAWVNVTTSNDTTHMIICGAVTTLSPFAVVEGKPISVQIMIKPPSAAPVSLNLNSNGVIPVAILSTKTFDATKINPASIDLEGAAVRLKGNGGFQCSASDVNGDGIKDLVCQVPTNQFQLIPGSDVAVLTAETSANQPIQGQEAVTVVPQ